MTGPLYFIARAADGAVVDVINVDECPGGWNEACCWAHLAITRDAARCCGDPGDCQQPCHPPRRVS